MKQRIRRFLFPSSPKPQGPIDPDDREFVSEFMYRCAHAVFECDSSWWYIDKKLKLHSWAPEMSVPYIARTARQNRRQEFSRQELNLLHGRLVYSTLVMMVHLDQNWKNRIRLMALCITVAEVTEEISFIFNSKLDLAMEMFTLAVNFGWHDDGFLYALCSR
jgi:hypothetical protein